MIQQQSWTEQVLAKHESSQRPLVIGDTKQQEKIEQITSQRLLLPQFRKHLFSYLKGLPGSKEFKVSVSQILHKEALVDAIMNYSKQLTS
jgi:tRNA-dihydrouridine synthase